jgi:hypothetical protein
MHKFGKTGYGYRSLKSDDYLTIPVPGLISRAVLNRIEP